MLGWVRTTDFGVPGAFGVPLNALRLAGSWRVDIIYGLIDVWNFRGNGLVWGLHDFGDLTVIWVCGHDVFAVWGEVWRLLAVCI